MKIKVLIAMVITIGIFLSGCSASGSNSKSNSHTGVIYDSASSHMTASGRSYASAVWGIEISPSSTLKSFASDIFDLLGVYKRDPGAITKDDIATASMPGGSIDSMLNQVLADQSSINAVKNELQRLAD